MSEQAVGPRAAWQVLRRRDFGLYFLGNSASATGGSLTTTVRLSLATLVSVPESSRTVSPTSYTPERG